ncbi:MAG TPA: NAD-dependent epimerase/dehydratase family protein, partial [Chloroflexota bacterium]|nr:NAD-dependent epimerase/dehydratase family protein [Chloroflexota bacterium]
RRCCAAAARPRLRSGTMRILVTGGAGFIGSHTVDALLALGHEVRILDLLLPPVHTGDWPDYVPARVERIRGSVTDREAFRKALDGIDAVFHLAAYQDYLTDFSTFFATNSAGTALLYELIVNDKLPVRKVVVASSQAIYGEGKYVCPTHGVQYPELRSADQLERRDWALHCLFCSEPMQADWTDEAVFKPHNAYALSKRDQDDIATKFGRRYGIPSVAMRYSIVQGPRQSFRNAYSGALRAFTVRALSGQPPVMYEDGEQLRDFVSVHDVVAANLLVLEDPRADYQSFNVGGNRQVRVRELAAMVSRAAGYSGEAECSGLYRVGDTRHIFSDVAKLRGLGWAPTRGMDEIVTEYVAWAAAQPDLRDTFAEAQARMQAAGVLRRAPA